MSLDIREGAVVELRGSKDDWQVIGQKHDGLVYKYVIKSRNTGAVKSAFAFEVFEKYTSTYFELNQYLFDQMFSDEPLFEEIKVLPDEDSDLLNTLKQVDQVEDAPDIASLLKQTVKQEPVSIADVDPSNSAVNKNPTLDLENSSSPTPKKRFKVANQESVEDLLAHNTEISTKRSTKWAVSTLKGMLSFLCLSLFLFIVVHYR